MSQDRGTDDSFDGKIFVNCPFDEAYRPLLMATIFSVQYMGMQPMLALDSQDSGEVRFHKILELVRTCRYGIHDLSRCRAQKEGEFYRLNMPLELGLDLGARYFGSGRLLTKRCLVMETEKYRYQKALSDIGGSDIQAHQDSAEEVAKIIREWLVTESTPPWRPPPSEIISRFEDFMAAEHERMMALGWKHKEVTSIQIPEFKVNSAKWIARQRNRRDLSHNPRSKLPIGIPVRGKRGFLISPHAPNAGMVDAVGIPRGTTVECPYSGNLFIVP